MLGAVCGQNSSEAVEAAELEFIAQDIARIYPLIGHDADFNSGRTKILNWSMG